MDRLSKEQRRLNMQAVKSSGSKIEIKLGKALFAKGYRYRKQVKSLFGKPDFVFKKHKTIVFVDSEFWHGKDWETKKKDHKTNQEFWYKKIEQNIARDKEVNSILSQQGWIVLRFWGKEIEKNIASCIQKFEKAINKKQ